MYKEQKSPKEENIFIPHYYLLPLILRLPHLKARWSVSKAASLFSSILSHAVILPAAMSHFLQASQGF